MKKNAGKQTCKGDRNCTWKNTQLILDKPLTLSLALCGSIHTHALKEAMYTLYKRKWSYQLIIFNFQQFHCALFTIAVNKCIFEWIQMCVYSICWSSRNIWSSWNRFGDNKWTSNRDWSHIVWSHGKAIELFPIRTIFVCYLVFFAFLSLSFFCFFFHSQYVWIAWFTVDPRWLWSFEAFAHFMIGAQWAYNQRLINSNT